MNNRLGADQHQLRIMPPISKDCSNTFLERSFIYDAPCEWNKLSECIRTSNFDSFRKSGKTIYTTIWMLSENNVYIIVIYVVITVNYCKLMLLLYSPLNSYLYVHWILDFKLILLLLSQFSFLGIMKMKI